MPHTSAPNMARHAWKQVSACWPSPRARLSRPAAAGARTLSTPAGPGGMSSSRARASSSSPASMATSAAIAATPRPAVKSPSCSIRSATRAAPSASGSAPSRSLQKPRELYTAISPRALPPRVAASAMAGRAPSTSWKRSA
jgi:hypothetical protein